MTTPTPVYDCWLAASGLATHRLSAAWHALPVAQFQGGAYAPNLDGWLPVQVPAHWQQHEPLRAYSGRLVYRSQFANPFAGTAGAPANGPRRVWLRRNGTFYWSQAYLNGHDLGLHEGYFEPAEHDITDLLRADNTLLIEVACPEERDNTNKRMLTGVFSHWDCFDPAANPGGIWLPIELHTSGAVRVQGARLSTVSLDNQVAQLRYAADLDAHAAGPVRLRWTLTPRTFAGQPQVFEQERTLQAGAQTISGLFKLSEPRLWWTYDLGHPDLYTATLEVFAQGALSDQTSFAYGVRHFALHNWIPHLNGVRFLAKGSNYPPGDMRIATMTFARYQRDIELAQGCHMNMLRVHAHVDHPALYAAADEAGMLLWQDMPLQWLYRPSILPEAQRQARAMIRLLHNHASVAVWCMHNEPVYVADTADERLITRLRTYTSALGFSWNRDVLDTTLARVARREDTQRPVVRSSGEVWLPRLRTGSDTHMYFGWYQTYGTLREAEVLRRRALNNFHFVTEFGAQSFPNVESCTRFMPADIAAIDFAHLAQHHSFQADIMAHWIPWREASSLAELVAWSQDYQSFINRYYIDRLRYHKYRPTGGIVPFLFCDPYPAVLWSILDYWRVPKRSYDAMRMAFNPQYAFTLVAPQPHALAASVELPLYVVNDAHYAVPEAQVQARLCDPDGHELAAVAHTVSLAADCLPREIDRLRLTPAQPGCYRLHIALTGVAYETRQVYDIHVTDTPA